MPYLNHHVTGVVAIWFHFLCKNIRLESNNTISQISGKGVNARLSNADFSWQKAAFVVKFRDTRADTQPVLTPGGTSEPSPIEPRFEDISCCCWGGPYAMKQRFSDIAQNNSWTEVLEDPFMLTDVVLDQLFLLFDEQVRNIAVVLGRIESVSLSSSTSHDSMRG